MVRIPMIVATLAALAMGGTAAGLPVDVAPLAAPDAFSVAGRPTGLPADLWRAASAVTARAVLPRLAARPLSPAAAALARRILATGAPGPAGSDAGMAGLRASALLALGDAGAAAVILARAPGLGRSAELSRAAAESALVAGDDARSCAVAQALGVGRDDVYWLRLRSYCLALAGETAQAQLTFDLAQAQARDPIYARLMTAKLAGGGGPGAASIRNGLDRALSRSLGLAVEPAAGEPKGPTWDLTTLQDDIGGVAGIIASGQAVPEGALGALIQAAGDADSKARGRLQSAALLAAALSPQLAPDDRARLAGFALAGGKAPAGRSLALDDAASRKLMGETALLVLWTAAEAGAAGPGVVDRAQIVRALAQVGLEADARAFAVEGLVALK
ncbi:hypothetical protein [Phenylobacterium sp.]|uniref:hypothetical protein n=1 Tax=Phenylobacterium sp. TaxID=1871053 RepID=UPI00398351BC